MPKYTLQRYREDSIMLREGLRNKRPTAYIIKTYFPDYKGNIKTLRSEIQNCLNGNSFDKTVKMNLMPIFKTVYMLKTGKKFKRKLS